MKRGFILGKFLPPHAGHVTLIESALARPRNRRAYRANPDLADLAAAYLFGLARNHGYVDGNKRVGHAAMETFLVLNGHELFSPVEAAEEIILAVAAGTLDRDELVAWLTRSVRPSRT